MPIDRNLYSRQNEKWWIGKRVRCLEELKNGWFTAPVGTEFVVTAKQAGLHLVRVEKCACCGLRGHVSKVRPEVLELLD